MNDIAELTEVVFLVPSKIKNALDSGEYERVGGIIRKVHTKEIVYFLKEEENVSNGVKIILTLSKICKSTIAFFSYKLIHSKLDKILSSLEEIEFKIDVQNFSKIQTGFSLAKEAEEFSDENNARIQIANARQSLEEGCNIFYALFERIAKNDYSYSIKSYPYLRLTILSQLAIIRSYVWNNEYRVAHCRLLNLKSLILNSTLYYIRKVCQEDHRWYEWVGIMTFGFIMSATLIFPIMALMGVFDKPTDKQKIQNQISDLIKANENLENILEKTILQMQQKNLKIPNESIELKNFNNFLDGYILELEYFEQQKMPLRKILKKINSV